MDQNATTVRYSDADLEEFRAIVEKKLGMAKDELEYLQAQILETSKTSKMPSSASKTKLMAYVSLPAS